MTFDTTSGGHLGLFLGHEALHDHWPDIMADVYADSKPRARRAQAEARAQAAAPSSPGR